MSDGSRRPGQITIVGLGAMGTLLAAKLAIAGYPVLGVVHTRAQAAAIARRGLRLTISGGNQITVHPAAVLAIDDVGDRPVKPTDLIIVAVKSYSTAAVAPAVLPLIAPTTLVVTLQNGLGNAEALLTAGVSPAQLVVGVTTDGATAIAPGESEQRGHGVTLIGPYRAPGVGATPGHRPPGPSLLDQAGVLEAFANAGLVVEWHDDIAPHVWTKLAVNAAINPITALLGLRNGDLVALPDVVAIMQAAVAEVAAVACAQGICVSAADIWPVLQLVLTNTAGNRSSMLQDRLAGRPTEIAAICGAIDALGRQLGVATPINRCLHALVAAASGAT